MLIMRRGAATARVGFNASCISPDGSQLDLIVDDGLSSLPGPHKNTRLRRSGREPLPGHYF
jgi:hypothetical protein